jgi:hypothetical protein
MPIRYRKLIYNKIKDHYQKEADNAKNKNKKQIDLSKPKIPKINPTYKANLKGPKK